MTLSIELTPQSKAWLDAEAKSRGLKPADIIQRMIEERAAVSADRPYYATPEEQIKAMDTLAEKNSALPVLSDSAFDRENIYEDTL